MNALKTLAACLLLAPAFLLAQPAPAASAASAPELALTRADVKPTACGEGGIGEVYAGFNRGRIEAREGKPGYRVNEQGYWEVGCKPPPPPPPPAACPGSGKPVEWTVGEHTCTTARPNPQPSALQQGLPSGRVQILTQWVGPMRGTLIERCTDGVRSTVSATCAPATHCDTGWSKRSGFPQVTYSYDARPEAKQIPVGEYAAATGSDGSTLRVQCVAGEIKPAPQCTAGQKVTQTYSGGAVDPATGKHLGDTRVYRYDGDPVDPGKLVKLMQIEGRPKPDGSPRFLMARCSASGQLQ